MAALDERFRLLSERWGGFLAREHGREDLHEVEEAAIAAGELQAIGAWLVYERAAESRSPPSARSRSAAVVGPSCAAIQRRHLAGARTQPRRRAAPATPPGARCAGRSSRRGSRTPTPAQSARAAFSAMSPPAGQTTTPHPHASARTSVPCPPWQTTRSHDGMVFAYDSHGTTHRVPRAREADRPARARSRSRSRAPARPPGPPAPPAAACARVLRRRGRDQHDRPLAGRRLDALARRLPQQRPDHPQPRRPRARVLELRQRRRPASASGRFPCGRTAAAPARAARARRCTPSRPRSSPIATSRSAARQSARPGAVRGSRAPIEYDGNPGAPCGWTWGMSVATGTEHSSAASAGAGVRMSDDRDVRREALDHGHGLARRPHGRRVGLQRPLGRGEHLVLGRGGELHPGRLAVRAPAPPRLDRHDVAALDQPASRAPASGTRAPGRRRRRGRPRRLTPPARPRRRSCVAPLLERPRHRRDDQRADARVAEHPQPLAHARRADRTASTVSISSSGQRRHRLLALALQVEVLHLRAASSNP